jgi:DNA integrity scanning protein DisA with diadenylate cyclase activity
MNHWYPREFAEHIYRLLTEDASSYPLDHGLDRTVLENILSICYQASFMREEERPSRFRLILRNPENFPSGQSPPDGLHRIEFTEPRPCSEDELRRLFPAASFHRSMIGVTLDEDSQPHIWGIVHTGPRWLQLIHGGTLKISPLPDSLIIFVTGPGRITVSVGLTMVAGLRGGKLITAAKDVLSSVWFREFFAANREEIWALHRESRDKYGTDWATIAQEFPMILGQNLMRRVISLICSYRHGGMLVIVPMEVSEGIKEANPYLNIKYTFKSDEGRLRVQQHIAHIMNEFAQAVGIHGNQTDPIGWSEYQAISTPALSNMDETLFEKAHLLAELTLVDGAVVLNRRFELLGFGAEISSGLDTVTTVMRALDIDGVKREPESVKRVGTRHRSAYRLCKSLPGVLAVVVSQDGQVRFVRWHDGEVAYWDQLATSSLDF